MATGHGQSLRQGLENKCPDEGGGACLEFKKRRSVDSECMRRQGGEIYKPSPVQRPPFTSSAPYSFFAVTSNHKNFIDRLPPEVILKIFSYLDAASLVCVSVVNKTFHKLANDNTLWYELYAYGSARKNWRPRIAIMMESVVAVHEAPLGFWKRQLLREMGCHKDTIWKKELRHMNLYTGMPARTEQVLRDLNVSWEITLTGKAGQESVYKQSQTFFADSSVTVCWNSGTWPCIFHVRSLQLHGLISPPEGTPTDRPRWRSLISKTVRLGNHWTHLGMDRLVKLVRLDEGIIVGIWRGTWTIAFVMISLHFHKLVERSLLGSLFCSYRPVDINPLHMDMDPEQRLHDHTVHILLHNSVRRIMHGHYSPLCSTGPLGREWVLFRPIDLKNISGHVPITGQISIPWKAEGLTGEVQNVCMVTLTVLDDAHRPLCCTSGPAFLCLSDRLRSDRYGGQHIVLIHDHSEGRVRMNLVWMPEQQQYMLICMKIYVYKAKVKKHSGAESDASHGY